MAGGGGGGFSSSTDVFQARLETDLSGVSNTLTLLPYKGNQISINGVNTTVPGAGMTRLVGANLITVTGADSGAPGAANTLYYVYVSNSKASFSPSSIRLSATPPSLVNGVKYLDVVGNALNWRFVGWVRLNATPQFESTDTNRLICNYYNRLQIQINWCPGYVDDNAEAAYLVPGGGFAPVAPGVGPSARGSFISNGEDGCHIRANGVGACVAGSTLFLAIGLDGTVNARTTAETTSTVRVTLSTDNNEVLSEGYHTADLIAASAVGNSVLLPDSIRAGAVADPQATYVSGFIQA